MKDPKIFSDAYSLTLKMFQFTKSMPKSFRPTLGRRLEDDSLQMVLDLRVGLLSKVKSEEAFGASPRRKLFVSVSDLLDQIRIYLRVCHDLRIISPQTYKDLTDLTLELGREIGGLLKAINQRNRRMDESKAKSL